jgi:RNA polymerase sigma-70 factor (ECF subfamily)
VITIEFKTNQNNQFTSWVKEYERLIFTVCLSFTRNRFDAEDLTQETFLSAYDHLNTFDGKNPKAFFTTIAANKCRDFLKSPKRKTGSLSDEEMNCIEDKNPSVEESVIQNDTEGEVAKLCSKLKEPYKSVAINYFCNDIKLSELSLSTGQNLKTLETQLYRAKKLLKALLKEESA